MYNAYASFEFIFILLAMSYSLRVTSYNCRTLKSSIDNVRQLCDTHDIIFLQETWLSNDELSLLKCLHADFYADGVSAMDTTSGILIGRPFGGIGILWRKSIGACIQVHKYNTRVMGIEFDNGNRKLLAVNIYMPYDNRSRNSEHYDEFMGYLGMVHSIIQESDVSSVYVIGDWNAEINVNSVFGSELSSFCTEHGYVVSDIEHMGIDSGSFTYLSEAHGSTSWIDHCICTGQAHASISAINVIYDTQSSDHFPLSICIDICIVPVLDMHGSDSQSSLNWGKASDRERSSYTDKCSELLGNIHLPHEALCCSLASCDDVSHIHNIASLYSDIVNCLHCAASGVILTTRCNCVCDEHNTPGWNEYVKDAHSEARDAFKLWILSSKPRQGDVFQSMKQSRARFKFKLRLCKRDEARIRADILADDLVKRNMTLFWSHVSKQNRRCIIPADTVGGATGRESIASMWKNHYANLFNCVDTVSDKESVLDTISRVANVHDALCSDDVKSSIKSLNANKACGLDNLFAEHLLYASPSIQTLLSICFNAFIVHGFLPSDLTDTVLVPIVKDKTADISDKGNYRPIALASVISKVFEMALLVKLEKYLYSSDYQFGFKPKHSTDLCIYTLTEVIEFYKSQSSSVYVCFMDASKAFDRVNHWTLFKKLIDRGMPDVFVRLLVYWYRTQNTCVRWGTACSEMFTVSNGVRQGGILSPLFCNVYMDGLSEIL